jgi:hypothetical protein
MPWKYTNRGLCQWSSVGNALTLLGVLMLVFGNWQYVTNARLAAMNAAQVPVSRHLEMATPAAFGLAVLVAGITLMAAGRRRQRAE